MPSSGESYSAPQVGKGADDILNRIWLILRSFRFNRDCQCVLEAVACSGEVILILIKEHVHN